MQKLLEQAQKLVADLNTSKVEVANQKAVLDKQANSQAFVQKTLDDFQAELLQRELAVKPIENAQKTIENANRIKAEADLDKSKVAGEWGALKTAKANFKIEQDAGLKHIADQKELYNRGAEENKIAKDRIDERAKKIKEATAGV
jgi:hypothetical protein